MSTTQNQTVTNLFKRVYGQLEQAVPDFFLLDKEIPYSSAEKVGDSYIFGIVLTLETGYTLAGTGQVAADINASNAGVVQQARVIPSQTVLSSVMPWAFISRATSSETAFKSGTKHVMENHLKSHSKLQEVLRFYGQATSLLGFVSYAASGTVYRGATYSGSGNVTLTKSDGTTIAFTAGINAASKAILLAPGQFAAGIWVGWDQCPIAEVDANGVIVAQGKVTGLDVDLGYITVDFTPIAASSTTSHRLALIGQEQALDMVGINKILTNTGTLFEISASTYSLWRGNTFALGAKKFNIKAMLKGISLAVNRGGLNKPLLVVVNPRTFSELSNNETAFRRYGEDSGKAVNGFQYLEFYAQNGLNKIVAYSMCKEGEAYGLEVDCWVRSGSAPVSFKIPGIDQDPIFPLQNQMGYAVRSYSDQFIICEKPAHQIIWTGINDEGVDF